MSHPVVTLKCVENVGHVIELLKLTTYNGFPVVDPPLSDQVGKNTIRVPLPMKPLIRFSVILFNISINLSCALLVVLKLPNAFLKFSEI